MMDNYRRRTSYTSYRSDKRKLKAYRAFKTPLPLFVRGGDLISEGPIATGVYEPDVKALIDSLRDGGYGDFLIDIGANIGLTSCQSGNGFKEVHLYEPNPDCVGILRVNVKIALGGTRAVIHDIGLGSRQETLKLHVPRLNWGGAFVRSRDNGYSEQTLAHKDGYATFDPANYDIVDIRIASARDELATLFTHLAAFGHKAGVVKIDVEGYETTVIEAILDTLPAAFKAVIIFENWADGDRPACLDPMVSRHHMQLAKLVRVKNPLPRAPRWINSIFNRLRGGFDTLLVDPLSTWNEGTYVLTLS